MTDMQSPVPWWSALFLLLVITLVAVLAIPSLRSRRLLVWTVVIGIGLLLITAMTWTLMVGPTFWTF
jgi:hypothetical protein